jgi:hypothetical protein
MQNASTTKLSLRLPIERMVDSGERGRENNLSLFSYVAQRIGTRLTLNGMDFDPPRFSLQSQPIGFFEDFRNLFSRDRAVFLVEARKDSSPMRDAGEKPSLSVNANHQPSCPDLKRKECKKTDSKHMPYTEKEIKKKNDQPWTNNPSKVKMARTYDKSEGNLVIWYNKDKPPKNDGILDEFGQIVNGLRIAREMAARAITRLTNERNNKVVKDVLSYHFKIEDKDGIAGIIESFNYISGGLNKQMILCFTKELPNDTRGEANEKGNGRYRIHLNTIILGDNLNAIARTIVHEASHAFASTKGTITSRMENGSDDDFEGEDEDPELYANDCGYRKQEPHELEMCADSYAWSALSLYEDRLQTGNGK